MNNSQPSHSAGSEPLTALNQRVAELEAQLAERELIEHDLRDQLTQLRARKRLT